MADSNIGKRMAAGLVLVGAVGAASAAEGIDPSLEERLQRLERIQTEQAEAIRQRDARIAELERRLAEGRPAPASAAAPVPASAPPTAEESTAIAATAPAEPAARAEEQAGSFEVYGFVQADYVQDFKRVNSNWDDTLRPSRIPTDDGVFGDDGQAIIGVRQSRLGVQAELPVGGDTLYTKFEFDMFGVGGDEGQTTIRLRHAYGQWGQWLAGQTHSLFMDIDVFPNTIDYWGPAGMVFLRNPQIRWTPLSGADSFAIAIEKPSNDIDSGQFRTIDPGFAENLQNSEDLPDLSAQYRMNRDWGHFQLGGLLRKVGYETAGTDDSEPSGSELGWGLNASTNIKTLDRDRLILSVVYGEGIASYMNDGGVDLAPAGSVDALLDAEAAAVELLGLVAYYDHYWNDRWSSSIGYSSTQVDNESLQESTAFKKGEYASVNLLHYPARNILVGGELLWGKREDNDGNSGEDVRTQITVKYNFSSEDFR
jgi:hypothetical protein